MRPRSTLAAWVLAMALSIGVTSYAAAQDYWQDGQTFSSKPKMKYIPNTDVYYQRKASGYDLYRYANTWYLVDDGTWYRANSWRGPFVLMDPSDAPEEVTSIPTNYRRYWALAPPAEEPNVPAGSLAWSGQFSRKPSMHNITADGVSYTRKAANGNVDLYHFQGTWYLVDDGMWYRSDSWRGPFISTTARGVPREILTVPSSYRRHWSPSRD